MHLFLFCVALAFFAPVSSDTPCPGSGHGKLLVHGGGGAAETYAARGLSLCGGKAARVVVVAYAMGGPVDLSDKEFVTYSTGRWTGFGATDVTILDLTDQAAAIAVVREADYIFFDGGDQATLVEWMAKSPPVMGAIRQRHAEGALVGGMSAGAAAMSERMIKGGESASLVDLKGGKTAIVPGLSFWPEVITDQHFVKRQRWARLVSAVLDNPSFPGIAIDEETAVLVDRKSGIFEVIGNGVVTVLDARHAKIAPTAKDENWSATNLRMTILRAGDRFDWRRGRKLG